MRGCILRNNDKENLPFTQSIYQLFRTKGDILILSYPYMRKSIFDKCYSRDCEKENKQDIYIRNSKIYTRESFKNSILEGFSGYKLGTIILIGCMQDDRNKKDMINFAFELEKILSRENINIELYISKQNSYYNKLALKLDNLNLKMLITGSSSFCTLSLWGNNQNSNNLDILVYDKYRLEKNILSSIKNIENSLALSNSHLVDTLKRYKMVNSDTLKLINGNHFIISPFEPYRIRDKILYEISSGEFTKIHVKSYKLDILEGVYYYILGFYKERRGNSEKEKEKYEILKANVRDYMISIKRKDIFNTLKIINGNKVLKKVVFDTINGIVNFEELIINILKYDEVEIKDMFKRYKNEGFINYYNKIYEYKL